MKRLLKICLFLACTLNVSANQYTQYNLDSFLLAPYFNASIDLSAVDVELIEAGVFFLNNQYRSLKQVSSLQYNSPLSDAAYLHSSQMDKYGFFDHTNKKNRPLATLEKRANYVSYENYYVLAENIFYGYIPINEPPTYRELCTFILKNLIKSKEHEYNLVAKDIKDTGNGVFFESTVTDGFWYFYFTQDFGRQ